MIDQVGVQRRNHESRARDGNDEIDLIGAEVRATEAFLGGLAAELHGMIDVLVIRLGEGARLNGVVDGEDGVTLVDLGVIDDSHHGFEPPLGNVKDATHVVFHVVTSDQIGRESGGSSCDCCVRRVAVRRYWIQFAQMHHP
jgi:hypothetical protein